MQSTSNLDQLNFFAESLTKAAYQGVQDGKSYFSLLHKSLNNRLTSFFVPNNEDRKTQSLTPETLLKLQEKRVQLLEIDWKDAQDGVYPTSLLFETSWEDFFRYYPMFWLEMPTIWERIRQKKYQEFSPEIDCNGYPDYYLQNFHYQTDGYLSDTSANLYDLQVDLLFSGMADPMRRRILKPLREGLENFASILPQKLRVLDVACGTGRTLKFIRGMLPKASLFGVDLSAAYLRKANQQLSKIPGELPQLVQANAEALPYVDSHFHAVGSVFLFHELPANSRQKVIEEAFRVLQPGGIFVICDSIQSIDSPEFQTAMENFPKLFHEPYYRHYITDNLEERLQKAGFVKIYTENHFMSKYWIAIKG